MLILFFPQSLFFSEVEKMRKELKEVDEVNKFF